MANIDIFNLDASGSELFNDSESFLADVDDQEQLDVVGGFSRVDIANTVGNVVVGSANLQVTISGFGGRQLNSIAVRN